MSLHEAMSRTLLLARDSMLMGGNEPTDEQLIEAFRRTRVLLVADEANLSAAAGQHAVVTLFNLLARLGVDLRLALPDVPLLEYQPPLHGQRLRAGLVELGTDLLPDCAAALTEPEEPVDVAFILGDSAWHGQAGLALRLCGDAWAGWTLPADAAGVRWTQAFPIGGLSVAGVAAPEAFKYALRSLEICLPFPLVPRFLLPVEAARLQVAPSDTPTGPYTLGSLDVVSGGAISHATLYSLLHLPDLTASIRIIEPERSDLSNLNRYLLLRRSACGHLKIETLASYQRAGVVISGVAQRYDDATLESLQPIARSVLVGVDDIPTRWAVQREWPDWLGVGATSHFLAVVSSHVTGQACVGCLHPRDDPGPGRIPTVSFVSYWAGFLLAIRLLRHSLEQVQAGDEQSIDCAPLRFDQACAYWPRPVAATASCPVRCPASVRH